MTDSQLKQQALKIFSQLVKDIKNPTTELNYHNDYQLLVAVVLSAQSTDVGVNKATENLFKKIKTPQQMLELGQDELLKNIKTIGLFNTKAKNVIKLSQDLVDKHKGLIPQDRQSLEALAGVGRKTANVVLNTAFNLPTLAVDTHIFRLGNRLGIGIGKTPLEVEKNFLKVIPKVYLKDAHHLLILHGRYVCKARKPNCAECNLKNYCNYYKKQNS